MTNMIPTYGLYGEASEAMPDFWLHSERISARSSRYKWEIKDHRHDFFTQIVYLRSGSGTARIGQDEIDLKPGSLVCIPEKLVHGFRFSPDVEGQVITLLTSRISAHAPAVQNLVGFMRHPHFLTLHRDNRDEAFLTDILERVNREMEAGFGGRENVLESYLTIFLAAIADLASQSAADSTSQKDSQRVQKLNELVGLHFREHLPVEFYARELCVSVTHLNRITKARTGRTMNELLSEKIIEQAKRDLLFTSLTAQEIAHSLGFQDPAYFTRYFARETGETPRQFRDRERFRHSSSTLN